MRYDPEKHRRRSIRLKGYDYSHAGVYFVTICTQGRACLFGEVIDGEMRLNDAGRMVVAEWERLPALFPNVVLDAFVVMPNHVHGIVILTNPTDDATDRATPMGTTPMGTTPIGTTPMGATPMGATTRVAPTTTGGDTIPVGAVGATARATTRVAPTTTGDDTTPVGAVGATVMRATTRVAPTTAGDAPTPVGAVGATVMRATTRVAPTTAGDDTTHVGAGLVPAQSVPAQSVPAPSVPAQSVPAPSTPAPTLGDVIGAFKSRVTVEYTRGVKALGWTPFDKRLWQRNYYEHIIRNEEALNRIRQYILENPIRWTVDRENPLAVEIESEEAWIR